HARRHGGERCRRGHRHDPGRDGRSRPAPGHPRRPRRTDPGQREGVLHLRHRVDSGSARDRLLRPAGRVSKLVRVLASTALLVSIITLFTRLVGFLRWLVFSPTVGAGTVGTAYQSANQVPNILFEVVAGGALAGAVIPLLAIPLAQTDRDTAGRIASALLTWAVSVTLPLSIVLAVLAPATPDLPADPNTPDSAEAQSTAQFLLMFSPQLVLYGIGAVLTGVLQAHRKFLWPAFAPLLSSLVVIGSYVAYSLAGGTDDS